MKQDTTANIFRDDNIIAGEEVENTNKDVNDRRSSVGVTCVPAELIRAVTDH